MRRAAASRRDWFSGEKKGSALISKGMPLCRTSCLRKTVVAVVMFMPSSASTASACCLRASSMRMLMFAMIIASLCDDCITMCAQCQYKFCNAEENRMTETTNYKLKKPVASDNAQVDVLNGNMDVIDRELKLRATLGPDGKVDAGQLPEMDISKALAGAELKDQPADNDGVLVTDSAAENVPKRVLWSRIKAALKGYFDPLYAAKSHSHAWGTVTGKPETFPPAAHKHSAADVSAGTLGGQVQANAGAAAALGTAQVRNIRAGTADLTAGSSSLASGEIYLVYE
nr:MAG TPA: hypothetical protein [Caudoviricetes sp.]